MVIFMFGAVERKTTMAQMNIAIAKMKTTVAEINTTIAKRNTTICVYNPTESDNSRTSKANIINNKNRGEHNNANSNCRKIKSNIFNNKNTTYLILNTAAASLQVMSMAFVHPR